MQKRSTHKAFTLIELLVVIAIIALLVSMLLPSLNTARDLAKSILCMNNQKTVGTSLMFYVQDNNDFIIPAVQDTATNPNGLDRYWSSRLAWRGYMEYSIGYFCPVAEPLKPDLATWNDRMYAYGMRDWFKPGTTADGAEPKPMSYISNAGDFFLLTDGYVPMYARGWYKISPSASPGSFGVQMRHLNGAVTLFADNHVENVKDSDYFETLNTRQGEYSNNLPYWVMD